MTAATTIHVILGNPHVTPLPLLGHVTKHVTRHLTYHVICHVLYQTQYDHVIRHDHLTHA